MQQRTFYLYLLGNVGEEAFAEEMRYLSFSRTPRIVKPNKVQLVLNFLREKPDKAFYTSEIVARLKDSGIDIFDVARTEKVPAILGYGSWVQITTPALLMDTYMIKWILD